jgi:hypothetical protein
MKSKYNWIVVGGGFRSLIAAYSLASKGNSVCIIEKSKEVGGFFLPIRWGDYNIDKGPQFFDNFDLKDWDFFNDMFQENIFRDIGFNYSSSINNTTTDGFAIPDWRTKGKKYVTKILNEIIFQKLSTSPNIVKTLDDLILIESGTTLHKEIQVLCKKFLKKNTCELSALVSDLVTFCGKRKLLFDQDISIDLKKSNMLDDIIAAQKKVTGLEKYNLYPLKGGIKKFRDFLISALKNKNVEIFTNEEINSFDNIRMMFKLKNKTVKCDNIFFGCDVRDSEAILFDTKTINKFTYNLPEIFHCFEIQKNSILSDSYYIQNYNKKHLSTRITNFFHYMDEANSPDNSKGVICVEQPVEINTEDWNNPEVNKNIIFNEVKKVGNVSNLEFISYKPFKVPITYKLPMVGIEKPVSNFIEKVKTLSNENIIIPNPYSLTRKDALDDLRELDIL